jgi:hypothetical protein
MLFVLAWSSVAFNLKEIYHPVMQAMFTMQPDQEEIIPKLSIVQIDPGINWPSALEIGRAHGESGASQRSQYAMRIIWATILIQAYFAIRF